MKAGEIAPTLLWSQMPSPIGTLLLVASEAGLRQILLPEQSAAFAGYPATPDPGWQRDDAALTGAREQLEAYFAGTRQSFDLPLAPRGTAFQRKVWDVLRAVPAGGSE